MTIGVATFSGGLIMTNLIGLPADETTVYGTFSFCCTGVITITFSQPVSNFSTRVLNGDAPGTSYVFSSNRGDSVTKSLDANYNSGEATFQLPGSGITSVTIQPTVVGGFADFSIDDVSFDQLPTTMAQCMRGGWQGYGTFKNQGDCVSFVATGGH